MDYECKVISNVCLKGDYYRIVFSAPEIAEKAKAGQFVHVLIPTLKDRILRRPFSINDTDPENGLLTVTYKKVGRGTKTGEKGNPNAATILYSDRNVITRPQNAILINSEEIFH